MELYKETIETFLRLISKSKTKEVQVFRFQSLIKEKNEELSDRKFKISIFYLTVKGKLLVVILKLKEYGIEES